MYIKGINYSLLLSNVFCRRLRAFPFSLRVKQIHPSYRFKNR